MTDVMPPDPQRQHETELLLAAQQGDSLAFGDLWLLLEPMLRRFVRRLIGWHDAEDDILQLASIALYRHVGDIDPPERLRAYVFRIVRNCCYDELRSQRRPAAQAYSLDADEDTGLLATYSSQEADQPEDAVYWLLLHMEVREAIDRLPAFQRQALILYAEEKMTYIEIAEVLGVQVGTVKSRLYYAKQRLRHLLRAETLATLEESLGLPHDEPAASAPVSTEIYQNVEEKTR